MKNNQVEPTVEIDARIFEFASMSGAFDRANSQLLHLASHRNSIEGVSQIDPKHLESYFNLCVRAENFDGLSYLTHYAERHGLDIGHWDASKCRDLLDGCLNKEFNISRVMGFAKFYVYRNKCRLANADKKT